MRKLTCYAWGKPGDWEALCVDYDLAAQGESLDEVRRELSDAIATFLDYVAELPAPERQAFLNRKTPLILRLRLSLAHRLYAALQTLKLRTPRRGAARAVFAVPPAL